MLNAVFGNDRQTKDRPEFGSNAAPHSRPFTFTFLLLTLVSLLAVTLMAYQPVLFKFYAGDDYSHLPWLKLAMSQPQLVLRNFYQPWMDSQLTLFYRPLAPAVAALGYAIWGANSLAFRVLNISFLAMTSLFVGLTAFALARLSSKSQSTNLTHLAVLLTGAGLFALYPSHPEAITWIEGMNESMCTMFILVGLWCYIQWRVSATRKFLIFSLIAQAFAFTCKETSIALAPTIVACEFLLGRYFASSDPEGLMAALKRTIQHTAPYFVLVAVYFLIRRLCLGTFVGGYDNSLLLTADLSALAARVLHALSMLVVPINKDMLGTHSIWVKAWEIGVVVTSVLTIATLAVSPRSRRIITFTLVWFLIALIPFYKVLAVTDNLQGSRLIYLASAPFSIFLALATLLPLKQKMLRAGLFGVSVYMLLISGFLAYTNNQAWAAAGSLSNAVQEQIRQLYAKTTGDPPTIVVGLPGNYKGAFVGLNAIDGMTKSPQLDRDVFNCSAIEDTSQIVPFGFLKDSIWQNRNNIKAVCWNSQELKLLPAQLPTIRDSSASWQVNALKELVVRDLSGKGPASVTINLTGIPCWNIDFVAIKLRLTAPDQIRNNDLHLLYKNDTIGDFQLRYRTSARLLQSDREQTVVFPLRGLAEWSFGGNCRGFKLLLPKGSDLLIDGISIQPSDSLIPRLSFDHSGYLENRGIVHLNPGTPTQNLTYDVGGIPAAANAIAEITQQSTFFDDHNCRELNRNLLKIVNLPGEQGTLKLNASDFPTNGFYQLRIRAIDKDSNPVGLAGDHIIVSLEKAPSQ